jgi:serine/threonine-protein kinase
VATARQEADTITAAARVGVVEDDLALLSYCGAGAAFTERHQQRPEGRHICKAAVLDAPAATAIGSSYVLDSVIGSGATGVVWRGRRRDNEAPVAVKVLRAEYVRDPDTFVRFLREHKVLNTLVHPHLVRTHDLVVEGGTVAVVMDLVAGGDLRTTFARRVVTPAQTLSVLAQVASALTVVHAAGFVHGDIKPENILVHERDGQPHAQLIDFGLARMVNGPQLTDMSKQLVGTPAYAAPELVAGGSTGSASDVYALGVVLYELLAGWRPFRGDVGELLRAHLEAEPPRPPHLTDPIWELLRHCLAKNPSERPTADALAARLTELERSTEMVRPTLAPDGSTDPLPPNGAQPTVELWKTTVTLGSPKFLTRSAELKVMVVMDTECADTLGSDAGRVLSMV